MKSNYQKLVASHPYVLVDFFATWCGPCKMISPMLQEIAGEFKGKVKIVKIDIDKNQRMATNLGVRSVPTLIFYKYGKVLWQQSGAGSKADLKKKMEVHL